MRRDVAVAVVAGAAAELETLDIRIQVRVQAKFGVFHRHHAFRLTAVVRVQPTALKNQVRLEAES